MRFEAFLVEVMFFEVCEVILLPKSKQPSILSACPCKVRLTLSDGFLGNHQFSKFFISKYGTKLWSFEHSLMIIRISAENVSTFRLQKILSSFSRSVVSDRMKGILTYI